MGGPSADFDGVVQNFYRKPDVAGALRAFEGWLDSREGGLLALHAFAWMAAASEEVNAGMEALRPRSPLVDAVLRGFTDPAFPRVGDGPPAMDELDLLWVHFFITGSLAPLLRIVGVLDERDVVRAKLTRWLRETSARFLGRRKLEKFAPLFVRCAIPVQLESLDIGEPLDVDLSVALAAKAGLLKFAELPVELSQPEVIRIAAKSAAVWSLRSTPRCMRP